MKRLRKRKTNVIPKDCLPAASLWQVGKWEFYYHIFLRSVKQITEPINVDCKVMPVEQSESYRKKEMRQLLVYSTLCLPLEQWHSIP